MRAETGKPERPSSVRGGMGPPHVSRRVSAIRNGAGPSVAVEVGPTHPLRLSTRGDTLAAAATKLTLADALLAVQKDAPNIQKTKINPAFGSKYISLDSLMPQILPLLNDNGLVLTQEPSFVQSAATGEVTPTLVTRLVHVPSGEVQRSEMLLMLDKQTAQGLGSAITYARRYSILAILGLVADVDDDGEAATKARKPAAAKPATTRRSAAKAEAIAPGADDEW